MDDVVTIAPPPLPSRAPKRSVRGHRAGSAADASAARPYAGDPVLLLGLPPADAAAFLRSLSTPHPVTTPAGSPLAVRIAALQARQLAAAAAASASGEFLAEEDGGAAGNSASTGGAGGTRAQPFNPVLTVGNYHSPGEGNTTFDDNACVLTAATLGTVLGRALDMARERGIGRNAAQRAPSAGAALPPPAQVEMPIFGGASFSDASPHSVNAGKSNVSPAAGGGVLAQQALEYWGTLHEAGAAGEVDVVFVNGSEQAENDKGGFTCTDGFFAVMSAAAAHLRLYTHEPNLGIKGGRVSFRTYAAGGATLIIGSEHMANWMYSRSGFKANNREMYFLRQRLFAVAAAYLIVGTCFPFSDAEAEHILNGSADHMPLTYTQMGEGGKGKYAPLAKAARHTAAAAAATAAGDTALAASEGAAAAALSAESAANVE